jgi:hypothetical protein
MQIVNESDRDVTWWCYNSDDWGREHTSPGGRGDLAQGGRALFNPPSNATGLYYLVFTNKGGSLIYSWWRPGNASTLTHSPKLGRDQTVTLRGSSRYEVVNPDGDDLTRFMTGYSANTGGYQAG